MPRFKTPLPEEISSVDPLPERCFYEKHATNLKLWKKILPAFVDRGKLQTGIHYVDQPCTTRDQHMSFADLVQSCHDYEVRMCTCAAINMQITY